MEASNPFQFGRALGPEHLVDRKREIAQVVRAIEEAGRLFLIGPRRYGKTSILIAAGARARKSGAVVLRYNAEAYPSMERLVAEIIGDAARELSGRMDRAAAQVSRVFAALRPELSYNPLDQTYAIRLGAAASVPSESQLVVEALNGLDRMARETGRTLAVVIDEFQAVVAREGIAAEGQLRAAIQEHAHVGYVFAGSSTTLLTEMTEDPGRPFYRLGKRLFVGEIPRADFLVFLHSGFEGTGLQAADAAVAAILERAEDVPYNVQRLAHECWDDLRLGAPGKLTPERVADVLRRIVLEDDPFYAHIWTGLTPVQQKALTTIASFGGVGIYSAEAVRQTGMTQSSMQAGVMALVRQGIARQEGSGGGVRYRLEDPFFAEWLRANVPLPR